MKATGVVRPVDDLGRIVIPIELRRTIGINIGDSLEFFVEGERIIMHQYRPGCILCGNLVEDMQRFRGKDVCPNCIAEMDGLLTWRPPTMRRV
ncbi:MAG: AbrB/MazE/SpoVT family DNA-binding domain-containing protein [Alicyclobacillus sp.]|nr:AbrB/MazE/SpoVT family DNA-binding domain-containing protein [Alicyclobacillus sp.]